MWKYSPHHRDHAEGHIFLGHETEGGVTILLTGTASMSQERLDELGERIVSAVNKETKKKEFKA